MKDKKFYLDETKAWKVSMRILKYLTLITIILGVYTYYPHSDVRNLEAEKYFITELNKAMKDKDVLETNLTTFTNFRWDGLCISYNEYGGFHISFSKENILRSTDNILDLSDYIDMEKSHLNSKSINHPNIWTYYCSSKVNIVAKKVPNTQDKYIFYLLENYLNLEKEKNEKK